MAWRNLWRNPGRTLITASGLGLGYLAAVVMIGLSDGMMAEIVENGTRLLTGQVQVSAEGYRPERDMHATIGGRDGTNVSALLERLEASPDVRSAAPRLYAGGLVSSGDQTRAGLLVGVDPERERAVSELLSGLVEGRPPEAGRLELLMGSELARQLGLSAGDEVVVVVSAADGSMGNDLYELVGVFETGTPSIDANYAIIPLPDLQGLIAMDPARVHEVIVTVSRPWETPEIAAALEADLQQAGWSVDVASWTELRPDLYEAVQLMDAMNFLIAIVIFGMAAFGVANTMLIGTFERKREFAVIRALGTTAGGVGRTVVYEGVLLGAMALAGGALLTAPILVWWHASPPDLSWLVGGFSWSGAHWSPVLRVEYSVDAPVVSAVALFLTAIVAAAYPAWKATRAPPADALAGR